MKDDPAPGARPKRKALAAFPAGVCSPYQFRAVLAERGLVKDSFRPQTVYTWVSQAARGGTFPVRYYTVGGEQVSAGTGGARPGVPIDEAVTWYATQPAASATAGVPDARPAVVALDGITATTATRRLIALAEAGGLRPRAQPDRHGRVAVVLNGPGKDALFGVIYVSARKGTILHAFLTHGNWGEQKRYDTVAEIRTVLKSWAALQSTR